MVSRGKQANTLALEDLRYHWSGDLDSDIDSCKYHSLVEAGIKK